MSLTLDQITVVVAAKDEAENIKDCISSLLVAAQNQAEIWIVDDASSDQTPEIIKSFEPKIKSFRSLGEGPGKARNLALKKISRPYVAFTDGDCVVYTDWLTKLAQTLSNTEDRVSSAGGIQLEFAKAEPFEKRVGEFFDTIGFVSDYIHSDLKTREVMHNPTCNVLYKKSALEGAQGFDETLWPCEDLDLDLRLRKMGYISLFNPLAKVEHRKPKSLYDLTKMMRRYGFAHAQLVKKHGFNQKLHLLILSPIILILFFVNPPFVLLLFIPFLFFFLKTLRPIKSIHFTWLLLTSITFWVFGFYSGLMRPRRIAQHG